MRYAERFPSDVLADIFLGKIKQWNDLRLARANPGVELPDAGIVVVHRSEGCSATYIFTDFLSKVSSDWAEHGQGGHLGELACRNRGKRKRGCFECGQANRRRSRVCRLD
jgi:ABC-type phosphate transport system substrate-binding protein